MIIGLFADIHANTQALQACLAHAAQRGVTQHVFLGDYVGYGGDPVGVMQTIEFHAARGAWLIKGNHDEAVEKDAGYMNAAARAAIDLARSLLTPAQKQLLADLPLFLREDDMYFVHGTADAPERWNYTDCPAAALKSVRSSQAAYTFSGHIHDQQLYFRNAAGGMTRFRPMPGTPLPVAPHRTWLAIAGSVGQPRDGNPSAAYAVLDRARNSLTFFRVPYDVHRAAECIRKSGLPESLAVRLENGA